MHPLPTLQLMARAAELLPLTSVHTLRDLAGGDTPALAAEWLGTTRPVTPQQSSMIADYATSEITRRDP
ncbi:MAG: hypothetical protein ACRCZP_08900 [Phycicoccus sp.]